MRSIRCSIAIAGCLAWLGCRQPDAPPIAVSAPTPTAPTESTAPAPTAAATPTAATSAAPAVDWSAHLGHCVLAEGYVERSKIGPVLQSGAWSIGVKLPDPPGDSAWSALTGGSRVRVQGVVAQRTDLPVFVPKKGEPIRQGIPVPEGTYLDAARRRFVIEQAAVTSLRSAAAAESALMAEIGKDVKLDGVVHSLNGHWWFTHDGVNLHLEGHEALPGFETKHGSPVTLHGRLERRPLPRLDQIVLKPNRDLAEAFLLKVREMTPHPDWPVKTCLK